MTTERLRIYCSGPLFNDPERAEMAQIAAALEAAGFDTFLPHRDGLEFRALLADLMMAGLALEDAQAAWDRAIFALDTYQAVSGCDAVVVNLNGRVPDEGAVAEAAMAFARGRTVVGYKNDVRSLVMGRDNAMVAGLVGFRIVADPDAVASALREALTGPVGLNAVTAHGDTGSRRVDTTGIDSIIDLGRRIWADMSPVEDLAKVARTVIDAI